MSLHSVEMPKFSAEAVAAAAAAAADTSASDAARTRDTANGDSDSSSDFSSAPSMGRQMTELSDVQCADMIERQCSAFQSRGSDFWLRQCTTPTERQSSDTVKGLKRQLSCPPPRRQNPAAPNIKQRACGGLASILDEGSEWTPNSSPVGSRQVSTAGDGETLDVGIVECAISVVVTELESSVSVADPDSLDSDLIAVSEGFLEMTGFTREEVIGENCRFLNCGCPIPDEQRQEIIHSVETGDPFTAVLVNRKKDGELFLNFIDFRGLVLARNARSREDIWILIASQLDVTNLPLNELPENHQPILQRTASRIHKRITKQLNELGLAGAMALFRLHAEKLESGKAPLGNTKTDLPDAWYLMANVSWKGGERDPDALKRSISLLPDLEQLRKTDAHTPDLALQHGQVKPMPGSTTKPGKPAAKPAPAANPSTTQPAVPALAASTPAAPHEHAAPKQVVVADAQPTEPALEPPNSADGSSAGALTPVYLAVGAVTLVGLVVALGLLRSGRK
mmetsp:Transcript_54562/g.127564  ORF Transcript_54562/g.127564 Transcript_54562/m.127564 type:complete len:509 (+) Transcript_54562:58-1584(+)